SGVVKLHVLQAKLNPEDVAELFSLAERHNLAVLKSRTNASEEIELDLCSTPEESDIIITNVRMRRRLERHLQWDLAKHKAIVTPDWLRDSVEQRTILPCGDYAALRELHQTTVDNCPDSDDNDNGESGSSSSFVPPTESRQEIQLTHEVEDIGSPSFMPEEGLKKAPALTKAHYTNRHACLRKCPLICPNQALVQQLEVIRRSRELEGQDLSALSYERAISVPYPNVLNISRLAEVSTLPGIGEKILSKITEYVIHGEIRETQTIEFSSRFQSLSAFSAVYGIGPSTARKLYDSFGLRTVEDLEQHYTSLDAIPSQDGKESKINTPAPFLSIKSALSLRTDLDQKIPRSEVELMHNIVMSELEKFQPGCLSTIVGGYRRGKPESNDVDIVITHPRLVSGTDQVKGLGERLVNQLYARGLITHVMHLTGFHLPNVLRTSHWDSLEKALTVFVLPPELAPKRIHRRLDLIFAAPEAYWTAITGWTGSKMFERDLRLWAKAECGLKFDSSGMHVLDLLITRRRDSKHYFPRTEQEVFHIMGLEWIDPTLRNADV
ncbi:hypothetical protein B0H15DRAFT_771111, partial [Mycena belliarum]